MEILKYLCFGLGCVFSWFGYMIYVKKQYRLINGFEIAFKQGRKTEDDAKRVGKMELIIGVLLLLVGIYLLFN